MLFFIFLLFGIKTNAQVGFETNKTEQVEIFLKGNVTVYSSDELFNVKIVSQKISIQNDRKSHIRIKKIESQIVIKNEVKKITFIEGSKIAQKKKLENTKKFVDKKTSTELSMEKSGFQKIIKNNSSEQFAHLGEPLKTNFITPSPSHDSQKGISEKQYVILIKSSNYLKEKKISDYNNQSKKFGFTKVLLVRPPPIVC